MPRLSVWRGLRGAAGCFGPTLLEDVLAVMPENMDDFSEKHQSKIEELLKLDNGDIPIGQVKFSPRRRQSAGQA